MNGFVTFHRVCTGRNHANPSWVRNFDLLAAEVFESLLMDCVHMTAATIDFHIA